MDSNNDVQKVLQSLKTAETIVDILIAQVEALCRLTDENGPLNKLLDEALKMTYSQKLPPRTRNQKKDKLRKVSKKVKKPRQSK